MNEPNEPKEPNGTPSPERVPVGDLIDLERLTSTLGRPPLTRELRAALPRGWVLEDDGVHARRDLRMLFREGWILLVGMATFGAVAIAIFWQAFPRGWRGVASFLGLLLAVLIAGGVVAPMITRALYRGRR